MGISFFDGHRRASSKKFFSLLAERIYRMERWVGNGDLPKRLECAKKGEERTSPPPHLHLILIN